MEREIFKIGDKVKIKPGVATMHGDWTDHKYDTGVITGIGMTPIGSLGYDLEIHWPNGDISASNNKFIDHIEVDWDE